MSATKERTACSNSCRLAITIDCARIWQKTNGKISKSSEVAGEHVLNADVGTSGEGSGPRIRIQPIDPPETLIGTKEVRHWLASRIEDDATRQPHDYIPQPEPPPVVDRRALPPDFPDIPQNASSELQPAPDTTASPDKVAGAVSEADQLENPEDMTKEEMRHKNARLREKINLILEQHPELRDATEVIAVQQGSQVKVATPFLDRVQANLQERARAIIERRPDLERLFDE